MLERDKPPEMIPDLQAVFKQVTATKTISTGGRSPGIAGGAGQDVASYCRFQAAQGASATLRFAGIRPSDRPRDRGIDFTANLQCKDAAGAEALKKAAEEKAGEVRGYFDEMAKANAGKRLEAMATAASQTIGQVKYAWQWRHSYGHGDRFR